jgi:hypothetical protein
MACIVNNYKKVFVILVVEELGQMSLNLNSRRTPFLISNFSLTDREMVGVHEDFTQLINLQDLALRLLRVSTTNLVLSIKRAFFIQVLLPVK